MAKVVTKELVRFSYPYVFEPRPEKNGKEGRYGICVIIPKKAKATIKAIREAVKTASEEEAHKFKAGKIPNPLKQPLRDGDAERPDDPAFADSFFLNATSKSAPGVVDKKLNPIMDKDEFYPGCWGFIDLNFYAYNNESQGIGAGVNNVMKVKDDERLGGGRQSAEDAFAGIDFVDDDDDDFM